MQNTEKEQKETTTAIQRYVDILTNSGFKALFGDTANQDVVKSILNVFLPEHRKIMNIEYLPTEHQGPVHNENKEFRYDFMCRDASGTVFIVELQKYREDDWFKRCVSYACRSYDRQNRRGEEYDVPPVYLIGLMDIRIDHPDKEYWRDRYMSEYTFREKGCHDLLGETIVIIFAELADFNKRLEECDSELDRILYVLKNIGRMLDQPQWLQNEFYTRIFNACEIVAFSDEKRIKYEQEMYDERRYNGELKTAKRLGREEGKAEGLAEGEHTANLRVAQKMLEMGMSVDVIVQATGLEAATVESLRK